MPITFASQISGSMKNILLLIFVFCFFLPDAYSQRKKKKEESSLPNKIDESMSRGEESSNDRQSSLSAERELLVGMKFFALDDYSPALESFQKALKINPKSSGIHYQIAQTLFRQKKYSEAAAYAEKAIGLEDNNKYYYVLLANIFQAQGLYEEGAKVYERMFAKKINVSELYYYDVAQIYQFKTKDYPKALKTYDFLEKRFGVQIAINRAKQLIFIEQKNYPAAIAEAEKLVSAFPENNEVQVSYAQILLEAGQEAKAQRFLEQYFHQDPTFLSHLLLLKVYQKQNKEAEKNALLAKVFENKNVPEDIRSQVLREYAQNGNILAEKELEKIAEKKPQDAASWILYAKSTKKLEMLT